MKHLSFSGGILFLGFGGVARCTLPLVLRHIDVPASRITVMDMADTAASLAPYAAQGVRVLRERLRQDTYAQQLAAIVQPGDIIIDLAWNISCTDMLQWCHDNDVLYVNTSVELWDPYAGAATASPQDRTLYARHEAIRALIASWRTPGATAVLEHGANPGLVSHFTKRALLDIGTALLREDGETAHPAVQAALHAQNFPALAHALNVRAIHVSEIDTQVSSQAHDPRTFANTWSVEGFFEEGIAPAEMGWGTHESTLPADGCTHATGPRNAACLRRRGMDTFVRSRVPSGEITGMVIRHGEAVTIAHALTTRDASGAPIYRPTVHYAYCPSTEAQRCLQEVRDRGYAMHDAWRIMGDDITEGRDELGVLLMGHRYGAWWTGTVLDIAEARRLVPGQNATTVQVAASVLAAVEWMIRNPQEGVHFPDDLPFEEILDVASPYLGSQPSQPIAWSPTGNLATETWEFGNFLLPAVPT